MTRVRVRPSDRTRSWRTWFAALLLLAGMVAACGGTASPSPVSSSGAESPGPKPSRWPGTAVLAVIKLGGGDGEIAKAGIDLTTAAQAGDVAALWGAADGLIPVIEDLIPAIDPLEGFDRTAELAGHLRTAFPLMLEGATLLRDSITAGDAKGVEDGSRKLAEGLAAYAPARAILADLVLEALLQQRIFTL